MSDFKVNVSDLKHRITIQKQGEIIYNDNGFPVNSDGFVDYKTISASINNLYGKEFYEAKAIQAENTVEFITRYSKDLTGINPKEYRIVWNSKPYNITFVDNIKYQNKWLKIKAIEVI